MQTYIGFAYGMGGLRAPNPPAFFCRAWLAVNKTETRWAVSEPMMQTYLGFASWAGGGGAAPPQPPRFLFMPCMACGQQNRPQMGRFRTHGADVH